MFDVKRFCEKQAAYNDMLGFEQALNQQRTFALFSDDEAKLVQEYQARFDAAKAKYEAL